EAMLGAGAMLTPGKVIKRRQLWMGRPAAYARDINDDQFADMQAGVAGYVQNAKLHAASYGEAEG
ncbi:MAG: gamma carbonic anhydrase family protein, partial [Sphingomonadales bacterium]|nr:gamma carbonic anhydrase family protein [Sphingomonadales bacterium]